MHHIFIDDNQIDGKIVVINHKEDFLNYNHLRNALRVKVKEKVLVSINSVYFTFDYLCEISKISEDEIRLLILEECEKNEMNLKVNIYQGLPKFDKMEYIIEKTVELGAYKIIPISMKNCVVKLDDKKSQTKIDRWNKISLSAATQSKRGIVPEVGSVINFDDMISRLKDDGNTYILYESADSETISNFNKIINTKDYINIIIGPEGGFSSDEIKKAKENNIKFLTLGKRILRTETAAIAFLSYVMINYELNNK